MNWLKRNYLSILSIIAIVVIALIIYLLGNRLKALGNLGYLGAFLISLICSLTIILPVPSLIVLIALASVFNPVLIAVAGSTGGTLGETTGYVLGYSGRHLLSGNRAYLRAEGWMKRWGVWAIMLFAFAPILPADVAGIASGALRFPLWKFWAACWVGKTVKYVLIILASVWGWQTIIHFFPWLG